jgi:hypothetical protein
VFDLTGRQVHSSRLGGLEAGSHSLALDMAHLAAGVYVVRAVMTPEHGDGVRSFTQRVTLLR